MKRRRRKKDTLKSAGVFSGIVISVWILSITYQDVLNIWAVTID